MTASTKTNVKEVLKSLILPGLSKRLDDIAVIGTEDASDGSVRVSIALGFPAERSYGEYRQFIAGELERQTGATGVTVEFDSEVVAHGVQTSLKPLPGIRNVIAVASGKGGVGKSTVSVNLALALAADGAAVGVLDADIYGPSQPHMLGLVDQQPVSNDGKTMEPLEAHGLKVMSIGLLIDASQPMAWRGPMVTSALNQMLMQTNWGELDYLVVDMPPGTGDIQLTLSQRIPVSGSVIVTTPQNIALLDARKGLQMFRKVSIPVLGVIENMSTHICSSCGHEDAIFGSGGGEAMAQDYDVELLGQLPLDATIRSQTDSGEPTVVAEPDSPRALAFFKAARSMSSALAARGKDYSSKFPNIVVEDS
ncbi:MAG: iron-sulfur cluster carrier protein ApbC [Woeseiaceae bacterium]|nr:iron-sulfur cluster carrier protein ApbC [Woeseiaceae bacterium]